MPEAAMASERQLLQEINEHVHRAQHVLAEFLPPDSGKSEEATIAELLSILDSRELHRIQREIDEFIGRRAAFFER
jgi:hypothetical protein